MPFFEKFFVTAVFILSIVLNTSAQAQNFDDYQLLRSGEKVPAALYTSMADKINLQIGEKPKSRREGKADSTIQRHKFYIDNSYYTDQLMRSGRVLFDDPIGNYLNEIKDYLLRDDPESRKKINVYLVRSSEVNAFATLDGSILINLGLFAKAQDEATLAFVLSHEIQHVLEKHAIVRFEKFQLQKEGQQRRSERDLTEFLKTKNLYSRQQELDADRLGLELLLQTDYEAEVSQKAMDLLAKSNLPFCDHEWDRTVFTTGEFNFPSSFYLDAVDSIKTDEYGDDSKDTHPNVGTRRDSMAKHLFGHKTGLGSKLYRLGEERFLRLRKIARFELCYAQLMDGYPGRALYTATALLKEHPESTYLEGIMAHGIYRLAKYAADFQLEDVSGSHSSVQGESQQLRYFLRRIRSHELNFVALHYLWHLHRKNPGRDLYYRMSQDLIRTILSEFREELEKLAGIPPQLISDSEVAAPQSDQEEIAAVTRSLAPNSRTFKDSILINDFQDSVLISLFDSLSSQLKVESLYQDFKKTEYSSNPQINAKIRYRKQLLAGTEVGADKVVYSPIEYQIADLRKPIEFLYNESDDSRSGYEKAFKEMAEMAHLEVEVLDFDPSGSGDIENILILNRWLFDEFEGLELGGWVNLWQEQIEILADKNGTDYFGWSSLTELHYHRPRGPAIFLLVVTAPLFVFTPYLVLKVLKPSYRNQYLNAVFDVRKGELKYLEYRMIKNRIRPSMVESMLYNTLSQIKGAEPHD
jgi:hypothetical protein